MSSVTASSECPICCCDKPHGHSEWELANVELLRGARKAFEAVMRVHLNASVFSDVRRGYYLAFRASHADGPEMWAERAAPWGDYVNPLVRQEWHFWLRAWMTARGAAPTKAEP